MVQQHGVRRETVFGQVQDPAHTICIVVNHGPVRMFWCGGPRAYHAGQTGEDKTCLRGGQEPENCISGERLVV